MEGPSPITIWLVNVFFSSARTTLPTRSYRYGRGGHATEAALQGINLARGNRGCPRALPEFLFQRLWLLPRYCLSTLARPQGLFVVGTVLGMKVLLTCRASPCRTFRSPRYCLRHFTFLPQGPGLVDFHTLQERRCPAWPQVTLHPRRPLSKRSAAGRQALSRLQSSALTRLPSPP